MTYSKVLLGLIALVIGSSSQLLGADPFQPKVIGTVGVGKDWEAVLLAAYDPQMASPVQGCISPTDIETFAKAYPQQLAAEITAAVSPSDSEFRKLFIDVNPKWRTFTLNVSLAGARVELPSGSKYAYFPSVRWSDGTVSGTVSFLLCNETSFEIKRKQARVIREQVLDTLTSVKESLFKNNGEADTITITITRLKTSQSVPDEMPGTVKVESDRTTFCFSAVDGGGHGITLFSGYKPGTVSYQVSFPELTRTLQNSEDLRAALVPGAKGRRITAPVYTIRNSEAHLEQRQVGLELRLCTAQDKAFKTDQVEWVELAQ